MASLDVGGGGVGVAIGVGSAVGVDSAVAEGEASPLLDAPAGDDCSGAAHAVTVRTMVTITAKRPRAGCRCGFMARILVRPAYGGTAGIGSTQARYHVAHLTCRMAAL